MASIGKLKIGAKSKRNFFDMSHDVNTTSDFGFCQPTLCQELIPDTKIDLTTKSFVRLAPLVTPSFARVKFHQYTRCIPITDVCESFDYMMANKSLVTSLREYIPQTTDFINIGQIFRVMLSIQRNGIFSNQVTLDTLGDVDPNQALFRLSFWANQTPIYAESQLYENTGSNYNVFELRDPLNDARYVNNPIAMANAYNMINAAVTDGDSLNNYSSVIARLVADMFDPYGYSFLYNEDGSTTGLEGYGHDYYMSILPWLTYKPNRLLDTQFVHSSTLSDMGSPLLMGLATASDYCRNFVFGEEMTQENADFLFCPTEDNECSITFKRYALSSDEEIISQDCVITRYRIGIHLTPAGRRLFKILVGLGAQFGTQMKKFELNKLFAYYKAWFDTFNPGRENHWRNTDCYKLIHTFYDSGETMANLLNYAESDTSSYFGLDILNAYRKSLMSFISELPRCCYVLPVDQYTVATPTPVWSAPQDSSDGTVGINVLLHSGLTNASYISQRSTAQYGRQVGTSNAVLDGLVIRALSRLYPMLNKFSSLGSKVDEFMYVRYGVRLSDNGYVGNSDFMCNIDDVMNLAESSDAYLGEYAGKGVGSGNSKTMHYETDNFAYLIQFICVAPYGGYVQGSPKGHFSRYDFFNPEFDSLGMETVDQSEILNRKFISTDFSGDDSVWAFRPRYFHMKVKNNLANGGFSLRSQMSEFLPYSLDRLFNVKDTWVMPAADLPTTGGGTVSVDSRYLIGEGTQVSPDETLRYIGLNEGYGNYDRLFYDNTGATDNFIVSMYQDFKMYAPMKPVSESFDTFDEEVDDDVRKVEHA